MIFQALTLFSLILVINSAICREIVQKKLDPTIALKIKNLLDILPTAEWDDRYLTFEGIVEARGYPVESHQVTTEDDYILTIYRIPYGRNDTAISKKKRVVFLQHGLTASATDWIIPRNGIAYMLADAGYDVWLGNARGTTHCRTHVSLDPEEDAPTYWNFSWDEIGYYDIPAMIDYVLDKTKQRKLFHIGHSQGTTTFYAMASLRPEMSDKIIAHFSLSPVAFMGHMFSPILRVAAKFENQLEKLFEMFGMYEIYPTGELLANATAKLCSDDAVTQILCQNVLFAICGFNPDQFNATLLPIIAAHTPAGAATKQLVHYAQLINSGHYRRFDFGSEENLKKYGSVTPPDYELDNVKIPVYMFYSRNDWLADERDVLKLAKRLPNLRGKFLNPDEKWNHLDFIYGIDKDRYINLPVISLMTKH